MTISSTASEIAYAGNGVTLAFNIPFVFDTTADLLVYEQVVATGVIAQRTTGIVITGGSGSTGTLTYSVAPPTGTNITILDNPERTQTHDYVANDPFPAESHEGALDKLTRLAKRLYQTSLRSLHVADGDAYTSMTLPTKVGRASKFLAFDANGNPIASAAVSDGDALLRAELIAGASSLVSSTGIKYAITPAETAAGVMPAFYIYAPSPRIDVRRYLTAWDDGSVQTTGLQAAINYTYYRSGFLLLPDGLNVLSGALSLTMTGNRLTQSLTIEGPGKNGAIITQTGTPAQLVNFQSTSPTTAHVDAQLVLAGFSLRGTATIAHGLSLAGIASFDVRDMVINGFVRNVNLSNSLVGKIRDNDLCNGAHGIIITHSGAGPYCNAIVISGNNIKGNSTFGIDFGGGSGLWMYNNDFETNGTTANTATGALMLRNTIDDESGYGSVSLEDNWFESNLGRTIQAEATTELYLAIRGGHIQSAESGRALVISGARQVLLEDLKSISTNDTWDITCDKAKLSNCNVYTLTDSGVNYPTYVNVSTSAGTYYNGRRDASGTFTLTGCTTSPTGGYTIYQQGNLITCEFPDILGTSNTTAATLTGLVARYRPAANVAVVLITENNGQDLPQIATVGSGGTITLNWEAAGTFTNSGSKGIRACTAQWRIA